MTVFLGEVYAPQKTDQQDHAHIYSLIALFIKVWEFAKSSAALKLLMFSSNLRSILLYEGVSCKVVVLGTISLNQ